MIRSAGTHLLYTCITIIMINSMINIMIISIIGDHLNKSLDGFPALITLLPTDENPVGALEVLQSS